MPQLAAIDFENKTLTLHADTATEGFDCIAMHFEIKVLTASTPAYQNYSPPMTAEGNISKGAGAFTPRYGFLASGWRIIPHSGVSHELRILVELLSEDGLRDRLLIDRGGLPTAITVDITPTYDKIEIREVETGALSPEDLEDITITTARRIGSYDRDADTNPIPVWPPIV